MMLLTRLLKNLAEFIYYGVNCEIWVSFYFLSVFERGAYEKFILS